MLVVTVDRVLGLPLATVDKCGRLEAKVLRLDPNSFANALEYLLPGLLIILALALNPGGLIPEPSSKTMDLKSRAEEVLAGENSRVLGD